MENRVTGALSPEAQAQIVSTFESIREQMPFLVELTPTEIKRIVRMEAGRIDFVRRSLLLALSNDKLAPQFFEIGEMEKDLNLCQSLDTILAIVDKLRKQISDTRDQAGHEAYLAALEVYNTTKRASMKGIPGANVAYDELKQMFEGQGRFPKESTNPKQS
jgi:hypothetical protein